jgi:HSP20 family protein
MGIRDIVPRRKESAGVPARRGGGSDALERFHREIDRMFADIFGDMGLSLPVLGESFGAAWDWPRVNVAESDRDVVVTAELPGVDEKNVQIEVDDDVLTLKGEVSEEHEEKNRRWSRVERRYGTFQRTIPLPDEVMADQAKATFKRGVLTITLPKRESSSPKRKTIPIEVS